ncbi:aminotransferase class I/II-fold pyridoxal phosphate-dependent enzyme [Bacillus sp. FSL W7-1360]
MDRERIFLSPPHIGAAEKKYVADAFESNWIAPLGPNVDAFEAEIADYVGSRFATATSSGTAAIHLALSLVGVGKGDIVFCSTFTFVASANPILYLGAKPVFIDSEPDSWNMSPVALQKAMTYYVAKGLLPKAVIVVNLYGQSADYEPILRICREHSVPVIEDAAESLGSTYKGKKSGTLGDFGVFSFNGNKIITTSGGGMLVSNNRDFIEKAKFLATQAKEPVLHYEHEQLGYNYRLSNVLAGIGRGQLEKIEERVRARRDVFNRYRDAFSGIKGMTFMPEAQFGRHNRWLTTLTIDPQQVGKTYPEVIQALEAHQIEARPLWKPLHLQPLFQENLSFAHGDEYVSTQLFCHGLCLPSGSNLTAEQQNKVIQIMRSVLAV